MNTVELKVIGMSCGHCKMNVENSIKKLSGISNVIADPSTGKVVVTGTGADLTKIRQAVKDAGYFVE